MASASSGWRNNARQPRLPAGLIRSQGGVQRMRGKQGVALSQRVYTVAAPTVVRRVVHQGGTHGVELDIALAQQSIDVFLHQ
jgi:hypothetical protein